MAKKPGSPNDLKKATEALYYEVWMLKESVRLDKENERSEDIAMKNTFVESFCVHLRNLIEFFGERRKDYITYQYFLIEKSNIPFPHNLKAKYNEKVNNLLSHLTFERLNYGSEKKDWKLGQIANEVNENFKKFIEKSDPNLLCDKLKNLIHCFTCQHPNSVDTTSDAISDPLIVAPARGSTIIRRSKK